MTVTPKIVHYAYNKYHKRGITLSELYANIWGEDISARRRSIKNFCEKVNKKFKNETNARIVEQWVADNIHCWIKDAGSVVF